MNIVTDKSCYQYLRYWLAALLVFLACAAAINYLVDPYGLFDSARVAGFNASKPAAASHVRLTKPYLVDRFAPATVVAGNSRPEIGIDPLNDCFPLALQPVFNLGLPGADVYMQARTLQHALAGHEVGLVLWGLDFVDFLSAAGETADPAYWPPLRRAIEDRLRVNADNSPNPLYGRQRLRDGLQALFSLDALQDSGQTVLGQKNPHAGTIRRDGFNPALDYLDIIAWEGQGVLFRQKNRELAKLFSRPQLQLYHGGHQWSLAFESVRRLLRTARARGTTVKIFINPLHADYLTLLDLSGRWQAFESWKRHLTGLANEYSIELWDFSGINALSTEPVPPAGDNAATLKWFWEPAHYRREYGDLMLARMLAPCGPERVDTVGVRHTMETVDAHLAQAYSAMLGYKNSQVDVVQRLQALLPD